MLLAYRMAMESPLVEAEGVDAMEFGELSDQYGVSGVPHTAINLGANHVVGAAPEDMLVVEIKKALEK